MSTSVHHIIKGMIQDQDPNILSMLNKFTETIQYKYPTYIMTKQECLSDISCFVHRIIPLLKCGFIVEEFDQNNQTHREGSSLLIKENPLDTMKMFLHIWGIPSELTGIKLLITILILTYSDFEITIPKIIYDLCQDILRKHGDWIKSIIYDGGKLQTKYINFDTAKLIRRALSEHKFHLPNKVLAQFITTLDVICMNHLLRDFKHDKIYYTVSNVSSPYFEMVIIFPPDLLKPKLDSSPGVPNVLEVVDINNTKNNITLKWLDDKSTCTMSFKCFKKLMPKSFVAYSHMLEKCHKKQIKNLLQQWSLKDSQHTFVDKTQSTILLEDRRMTLECLLYPFKHEHIKECEYRIPPKIIQTIFRNYYKCFPKVDFTKDYKINDTLCDIAKDPKCLERLTFKGNIRIQEYSNYSVIVDKRYHTHSEIKSDYTLSQEKIEEIIEAFYDSLQKLLTPPKIKTTPITKINV
jgi:hypothetical protein